MKSFPLVVPTRRFALAVGLIGVATIALGGGGALVALLSLGLLAALVVDGIFVSRASLSSERQVATTVPLLVAQPYELDVAARTTTPIQKVRQPSSPEIELTPDEAHGGALTSVLTGAHRGRHQMAAVVVRVHGPLGFASRDMTTETNHDVRVIPDLPKARRMARARRGGGAESGRAHVRLGAGTEFDTIRDYSPDDDIRQVNWIASSRAARWLSNQYRVDENRDVLCLLDTGRLMQSPIGPITRLDVALDALTTLCVDAEAAADRVGAIAFSSQVWRHLSPRRLGAAAIVDALYDLEATEVESDYERAFIAVGRHKRALIVVFTDLVDDTASRALLDACQVLVRRHAVMVVTAEDPDLMATTSKSPQDITDVVRSAVALDLIHAKDRTVALLRDQGVVVVDAPGDRLGSACVQAYARLKSRGRL